jgi:hypothetical protein
LGVTSVAAPKAASSSTARYSSIAPCRFRRQTLLALNPVLPVCVGLDQAGIDGKTFSADQSLTDAAPQDRLEHAPQQIALAETAMSVLRERRMVRHIAIEAKATEPQLTKLHEPIDRAQQMIGWYVPITVSAAH